MELLVSILFFWLFFKAVGLTFRIAWGVTKIIVSVLFAVALPLLIGCLLFAGGVVILVPVALVAVAFCILRACV